MPEYPLLPLPESEPGKPPKAPRFPQPTLELSPKRQGQRLGTEFDQLEQMLDSRDPSLSLRKDPASIAPERALVLEIAGSVGDFYELVRKTEGLEFLADDEKEFDPDEDFFVPDTRKGKKGEPRSDRLVGGRLYLAMPNLRALRKLVSRWNQWRRGEEMPRGSAKWSKIFARLHRIRPWGPADRLTAETIKLWREEFEAEPAAMRRVEAELWFRENAKHREDAFGRLAEAVSGAGGSIVHHAVIEDIGYDAVLIDMPSSEIERLAAREEVHLVICDDVMFLRPQSSVSAPQPDEQAGAIAEPPDAPRPDDGPPIAALLDGVPVQRHQLLDGRIEVDDPDGLEAMSDLRTRDHGTAMASVILHGDRNRNEPPIPRKLHVRPVMYAPTPGFREVFREDQLLLDVIYRAVRRMKEGDREGEATAPEVFLVNLSLGDPRRPFAGPMSPWAKLLDHLAERYGVLFLVSAGNITQSLPIARFADWSSFERAAAAGRKNAVLEAIGKQKARRTLLSPAEALNVLTVGAWHEDDLDGPRGAQTVDPYEDGNLPNVSSALGPGHRRIVKPDIHLPGGREHVTFQSYQNPLEINLSGRYGLIAAAPDEDGTLNHVKLTKATSAATALATRAGHRIFDTLMDTDGGASHATMEPQYRAVVVKALLVHRSRWGKEARFLDGFYGPHGQGQHIRRRDNIARLMGYGFPEVEEAMACAPNRATLVGYGTIKDKDTNIHRIPLPPSLDSVSEPRALTITVAWLSPVNFRHQSYRCAKLEVDHATPLETALGVTRSPGQPADPAAARGTVFHARYEGRRAVQFVDDRHVLLRIFCRKQAGRLDHSIRYGVAVTIEAGQNVPVYQEVRSRLAARVRPGTP